ncbi:MAG TPA: DUF5808 domain-containing protein [Ktedonobacterales bacterium]|nr:DUF5808 domain-containing protein [Ktedonobacterales bacterium]
MKEQMSHEEPGAWKLGVFYVNPQNPALWVPKRFSPGWTINLGHPKGRLALAGIGVLLGIIILTPLLVMFILLSH